MKHPNLERDYGVVRFEGTKRFHRSEELIFQSDDVSEAINRVKTECLTDDAEYHYRIIFKDDNH
jgi:hypothetical protein